MNSSNAFKHATELLALFVEHPEIPPGGTTGTAASHGEKTGEFLTAMHRTLFECFKRLDAK